MEFKLTEPTDVEEVPSLAPSHTTATITINTAQGRIRLSGDMDNVERALAQAITTTGLPALRRHGVFADRLSAPT